MTQVPEGFRGNRVIDIYDYIFGLPALIAEENLERVSLQVVFSEIVVPIWISTRFDALIGDPDVCVFHPTPGAAYFEMSGTNELYVIGAPNTSSFTVMETSKVPATALPVGRNVQPATRIITECGGGTLGPAVGGFFPFLPADPTRRRVTVKVDNANVFAALSDGTDAAQFMPIAPGFPGYTVVEGTEALFFTDLGTGPTSAWWMVDREVPW